VTSQFIIRQLKSSEDPFFAEFRRIYSESFPLYERRNDVQQVAVLSNPGNVCDLYFIGNQLLGFISYWKTAEFIFIEHLAISSEFQGKGSGSAILKPFIEIQTVPVILEIEPPADEKTHRRLRFYESLGFVTNPYIHFQPPYHVGDNPLPLIILTYPYQIDNDLYNRFSHFQKKCMSLL
jgi:GNAT superfamily N-acetyltransferase